MGNSRITREVLRFLPGCCIACAPIFSSLAWGLAPEDPGLVALLAARAAAESEVGEGNHAEALDGLLQSLRDADGTRPELADATYGNAQLVSYVLLHVMPEPAAYAYLENGFQPNSHETDKLVKALCTIAIGLEEEDKTAQTREVIYLTTSENHLVRAMAMIFLSNLRNPTQSGHRFRRKAATHSDGRRPPIPTQSGHFAEG